ncbi:MAG: radical SAM protein [Dehalococcoidia bacterium]|nr:radical SAM protein [Dehalococcoidia bacterium]
MNRIRDRARKAIRSSRKWLNYRRGSLAPRTYPDRMYLECTNVCNLSCVMCPNGTSQMNRPKGFMDFDLFARIVDEMAPHVETTTLHIWGEPLLHPRIHDMIALCKRKGLPCEISTNATLLDREMTDVILESGLEAIYLCLDGARAETYEKIRRRADFQRTKDNILQFLTRKIEKGCKKPLVNLQIIEMEPTIEEIQEFTLAWRLPGVDRINVKAFDSWGGQLEGISSLGLRGNGQLPARYHCPNLWYHVHIYWDGTLVCCDRDFDALYPLGNVSAGVMKAWRGPEMAQLRRKHLEQQLEGVPSCRNCVEWSWWSPTLLRSHGNAPQRPKRESRKP